MPLYEYVCHQCNHAFEALVFGAEGGATCPKCESAKVEKQPSARPAADGGGVAADGMQLQRAAVRAGLSAVRRELRNVPATCRSRDRKGAVFSPLPHGRGSDIVLFKRRKSSRPGAAPPSDRAWA